MLSEDICSFVYQLFAKHGYNVREKKQQKGSLFDDYIMQKYCRFILDSLVTKITFY